MKRNLKLLQKVICLTLVTVLFCGCGNAKSESVSEEIQAGGTQSEEMVEETAENASEEAVTQETEKVQEESSKEADGEVQGETYQGMPVAQVDATVADIDDFLDYADSFKEPTLFVYNEMEGYVINMKEGEYYHLKEGDRIFEQHTEKGEAWSDTLEADGGSNIAKVDSVSYVYEMKPDYSQYDSPHEVLYTVSFTGEWENEDDYFLLTCYFDAPVD